MNARVLLTTTLLALPGCLAPVPEVPPPDVSQCAAWPANADVLPPLGDGFGPASSALALSSSTLVIAAEDHDRVLLVDATAVASGSAPRVLASLVVGAGPSHVLVEGERAFVTTRGGGTLEVIDLVERRVVRSIPVGVEPRGLTRLPGDLGVAVALAGEQALAFVDLDAGIVTRREALERAEPWSVAVAEEKLVVGHRAGPFTLLELTTGRHARLVLDATRYENELQIGRDYRPEAVAFSTLTAVGSWLLAPHSFADHRGARGSDPLAPEADDEDPSCPGYYGGCGPAPGALEPALTWLRYERQPLAGGGESVRFTPRGLLRGRASGAAESTAVAIVRAGPERAALVSLERGRAVATMQCVSLFRPLALGEVPIGAGAEAIVPAGDDGAFVWNRFDRTLSRISFEGGVARVTTTAPLLPDALPPAASRGRKLFHDATALSASGAISCASCHPDGRDDGLSWRFPSGSRNTPSLVGGILDTAPFHWSGDIPDVHGLDEMTVQTLMGGPGLDAAQLSDLMAYIAQLPPPPVADQEPSLVERGRELFESSALGCTRCHAGADRTDNRNHVLDTTSGAPIQTPPLHGLARSGPYLHRGTARSLEHVVAGHGQEAAGDRAFDDDEVSALVAFLKTL